MSTQLLIWLFLTGVLAGGCAVLTGRAIALTWRPAWHLVPYMAILTAAVRFLHYGLFEAELVSLSAYVFDLSYLLLTSVLSFRIKRTTQMTTQYDWLYQKTSPISWTQKTPLKN